jgi:predicted nuclease of predicted toxin-antitoxin system
LRLLADENVHARIVGQLRRAGYEVEWIAEHSSGLHDDEILDRPDIADLVFITFDRDFGELIFKRGASTPRTIIYSRLGRMDPDEAAQCIADLVEAGIAERQMITITREGVRVRPFPDGAKNG